MIRSWWARLKSQDSRHTDNACNERLLDQVRVARTASDLRETLREQAKRADFFTLQLPIVIERLSAASWSALEVEKVLAYADFFSGANARGYERVMNHSLARQDYLMFMTACAYCYLADRFTEGAALLDIFQPHEDSTTNWFEYWALGGYINFAAGRPIKDTLAFFDQALEHGCFSPLLATNAYPIYFEAGRLEQCGTLRELIQKNCADDPETVYALAGVELACGYYGEGFRLMESRYRMPELSRTIKLSLLPKPRWNKHSLTGKRLLIHGEQGLGDMIMMSRYLPLLQEQGAQLLVDGRAEASSLMAYNFPYCQFIVVDLQSPVNEPFDYWTGIMSLPYHFNSTAMNVPATKGYLSVPPEQGVYWQQRIQSLSATPRLRVGLTWSGNPGHRADRRRSMSFELMCSLVRKHPDIYFFSLQTHVPEGHPENMMDVADELMTLADTAAVISEMDLVISVDTSAVHLAGALGRPTWLLLPYRYEWRWGLEGEANPWYTSVRVLRQKQHGAWTDLLDDVSQALQSLEGNNSRG